jgi:PhnB protein
VKDVTAAIEFYKDAFGAVEGCRVAMPGSNQVMHAGLQIGNSMLMLGMEMGGSDCTSKSPNTLGGTPVTMHLDVDNVDETFQQAIEAGAQEIMPPTDMFWGDRYGRLKDPFGHEWSVATQIRELSQEEMQAAAEEFFRQSQPVG